MIIRRFVAAFIIVCMGLPSPSFADTLRITQEGTQQSGLEEKLQGRDEAQLFLDPVIRDGQIVGSPEPFRIYKNFPPTIWNETEVQNAKQLVLSGVRSFKAGNGGAAGFSFSGKTYKTALQYSPSLRFLVLIDRASQKPIVAFDMETHQQVFPDPDLIDIFLDPKISGGQIVGSPEPFRQYLNILPGFWSIPAVTKSTVVALSNVSTARMSGGENATNEGRASFFLARRKYPTTLLANPQLRLLVLVDPQTQLPTAAYDMATHQQVYPVPDLLEVFLNPQIRDGQLVGSPSPFRTYDRIPASFWNLKEVKSARQIAVSHFKTHQVGHALTADISLAGRPYSITHPYHAQQQLLLVIDPVAKTPIAAFDMKTHEQVYPIPDQISVYLNPEIEEGQWKGDPGKPFATRARISAAFLDSSEVKKARSIVLMPVPVYENKAGHISAFSVAGENYNTTLKYDSAIRLLVLVDPKTRKPTSAYDITTGQQAYPIPDPIEVFLDPDIQEGRIAGASRLFMTYQKQPKNLWSLKEVKSARRIAFSNVPTYRLNRAQKVLFGLAGRKYVLPGATDPSMRLLVVADAQTKLPLSAYDMTTGRQVYPALPADEQLRPLARMAAEGTDAWVTDEEDQAGLEERKIEVRINPRLNGTQLLDVGEWFISIRSLSAVLWPQLGMMQASRVAFVGVPTNRASQGKTRFKMGSREYRVNRDFPGPGKLKLIVIADVASQEIQLAFDEETKELIYQAPEPGKSLRVYLDPPLEQGKPADGLEPWATFPNTSRIPPEFWKQNEVQAAQHVLLDSVATYEAGGRYGFTLLGKPYRTEQPFQPAEELSLWVLVDPRRLMVVQVFNAQTGQEVLIRRVGEDPIRIYADPVVEKGQLVGTPSPVLETRNMRSKHWTNATIQAAHRVVLDNVRTKNMNGTVSFGIGHRTYHTTLHHDPARSIRLLVVVDPRNRIPQEVFDKATHDSVYALQDQVQVFRNPVLEAGRLAGDPIPVRAYEKIPPSMWAEDEILGADTIGLLGVTTMDRGDGRAVFSLLNKRHVTDRPWDAGKPLRLLVLVNPPSQTLVAAYDVATGERVSSSEEMMQIYLDPVLEGGRLQAGLKPLDSVRSLKPQFWTRGEVTKASRVVIAGFPTHGSKTESGDSRFKFNGKTYFTSQPYDPDHPLDLLLVVDAETREVLESLDMATGERVYPPSVSDRRDLYLNPQIESGFLVSGQKPHSSFRQIPSDWWDDDDVQQSGLVAIANMTTSNQEGTARFGLAGREYRTDLPYESGNPPRLLVLVDPKERPLRPLEAFDQSTGKKVFTGSYDNEVQVFLDPPIQSGKLIGTPEPHRTFRSTSSIRPTFWEETLVRDTQTVAILNVAAFKQTEARSAFRIAGQTYYTTRSYQAGQELLLLVLMDAKTQRVTRAFDRETGEKVYEQPVPGDLIDVILEPQVQDGRLVGDPPVHIHLTTSSKKTWEDAEIRKSNRVAFRNVKTAGHQGRVRFWFLGEFYFSSHPLKFQSVQSLLVIADPAVRHPLYAFDLETGEMIYSVDELIRVYLGARVQNGRLEGNPVLQGAYQVLSKRFWASSEVSTAESIVLDNVPTRRQGRPDGKDKAVFSMKGKSYITNQPYREGKPPFLLVDWDPKAQSPRAAYDRATGTQVYPSQPVADDLAPLAELATRPNEWVADKPPQSGLEEGIQVYLNPTVSNGRVAGESRPVQTFPSMTRVTHYLRSEPQMLAATSVALTPVPAYRFDNRFGFVLFSRQYLTDRDYNAEQKLSLLLRIDPKHQEVLEVFDAETGTTISVRRRGEDPVAVYADPEIEKGRLVGKPTPVFSKRNLRQEHWSDPRVQGAQRVVLANVRTRQAGSTHANFGIGFESYYTTRKFDPKKNLRLLVEVDGETRLPMVAYDMETAEVVYNAADLTWVYLDPPLEKGHLPEGLRPYRILQRQIGPRFWEDPEVLKASRVVFSGVYTRDRGDGTAAFSIANHSYGTDLPFIADDPLRVLVVVDPRSRIPEIAYDQKTGQQVFSSGDLIRVYIDPEVEEPELIGNPVPDRAVHGVNSKGFSKAQRWVVLDNVSTHESPSGAAVFTFLNHSHTTSRNFDEKQPLRLRVFFDVQAQEVTAAYELETLEPVYPISGIQPIRRSVPTVGVYLNPVVTEGRLEALPEPLLKIFKLHAGVWKDASVQAAKQIAIAPIRANRSKETVFFQFNLVEYGIDVSPEEAGRTRLAVVADTVRREPVVAFDLATGRQVFPGGEDQINVYVDPPMESGRLVGEPPVFRSIQVFQALHLQEAAAEGVRRVVLKGVQTSDREGITVFSLLGQHYYTTHRQASGQSMKLLVVVNAKSGLPEAAYDQKTGEQIFNADDLIRVHLDPVVEKGHLAADSIPIAVGPMIRESAWREGESRGAQVLAAENVPTYNHQGTTAFHIQGTVRTNRRFDPEKPFRVLALLDVKSRSLLVAYDMVTGEMVYDASAQIQVYADPTIDKGFLVGNPEPATLLQLVNYHLWNKVIALGAKTIALQNYPTTWSYKRAAFSFMGQVRPTTVQRQADEEPPVLLVVADVQTQEPIAAYDSETGQQVYSPSWLIRIHLDPTMQDGRIMGNPEPHQTGLIIRDGLFQEEAVQRASVVVLENVPVRDENGVAAFRFLRKTYRTNVPFPLDTNTRLLVAIDPKTVSPTAAYDQQTGQQVYAAEDIMLVYIDPLMEGGRLAKGAQPFKAVRRIDRTIWNEEPIQRANQIAVANVHARAEREGLALRFSFSSVMYATTRKSTDSSALKLLVLVNPKEQIPLAAYDMTTGEQVYAAAQTDDQLRSLAELASSDQAWVAEEGAGDEQAGLEEMEVYLDPRIKDGRLEPGQSPYWTGNKLNRHFWDEKRVRQSQVVAIANRRTEKAHNSDSAVFSVRSVKYTLDRPFNAARPETLLVVMGLQPDSPVEAYLMGSGEKVYTLGAEDLIRIYLDPPMEDGKFIGEPEPFLSGRFVPPSLWRDAKVAAAKKVVVDGVSTFNLSSGKAGFHSGPRGRNNATGREFDSSHPLKLRVVMDRASRLPLGAFDTVTGEQVYPAGEQISVYLDPVIEAGRLKRFSRLFFRAKVVRANVWQGLRKITTQPVALQGVPTYQRQRMAAFSIGGKKFETTRIFEQEHPLRLLVIVEPSTLIPSAAYDAETGERVYSSESLIGVHLNPEIRDGKLVDPGKPSDRVAYLSAAFWDRAEVQAASTVALQDVEAISVAGGGSKPRYGFTLRNTKYRTERPFNADVPLKLLIVANPRTQKPLAAYDQTTGEQIYDAQKLIQVHLNPTVEAGRLVSPAPPYASTGVVQAGLWRELASEAPVVALSGIRGFHQRGVLTFHIGDVAYRTYFPLEKGSHADLLVIARTADKTPMAAYILKTGQKIYPSFEDESNRALRPLVDMAAEGDPAWVDEDEQPQSGLEEGISVYLDPVVEKGRLTGNPGPYGKFRIIRRDFWEDPSVISASVVALSGLSTHDRKGTAEFSLGGQSYLTSHSYDSKHPLKLLAVVDRATQVPTAAYDLATGEGVYPPDQMTIYLDPKMMDGRLVENPIPYKKAPFLTAAFYQESNVQAASAIVLSDVSTHNKKGNAGFTLVHTPYRTSHPYDPEHPLKLIVVIDRIRQRPTAAYDMATGKEVYSISNYVSVYLDPPIVEGRLPASASPYDTVGLLLPAFWKKPKVLSATNVVLSGVPTKKSGDKLIFRLATRIGSRTYFTSRPYDADHPLKLLVVVDRLSQLPTAAYDLATGEQVYSISDQILVYLDPSIEKGRLTGNLTPHQTIKVILPAFFKTPSIRTASVIGLSGVPTHDRHGRAEFSLGNRQYRTSRRYDADHPFKLLVAVDRVSRLPTAAYDLATGEQVYAARTADQQMSVFLNTALKDGKLVGNPLPYQVVKQMSASLLRNFEKEKAETAVLAHVPTHGMRDRTLFSGFNRRFVTTRSFDKQRPLYLNVVLHKSDWHSPVAAYDEVTGEQVYPVQPTDQQLEPLRDMAAEGLGAWVEGEPPPEQGGLEEVATEVMADWSESSQGQGLMVVSPEVLSSTAGPMIRQTVSRLPDELSSRILFTSVGASAEDVAITVLQQDPLPERVWVVGSFGPVFSGMLRGLTSVTELAPGSGLEEFLAQVGLMLGVPVEQIESGLEEIRNASGLREAA